MRPRAIRRLMRLSVGAQKAVSDRIEYLAEVLANSRLPEGSHRVDEKKEVFRNHFPYEGTAYYVTYVYTDDPPVLRIHSVGNWEQRYREHLERKLRDLRRNT